MKKPDFLIIGAMRCGTSALTRMLRQHPDVHMPGKELHYFDKTKCGELNSCYLAHFKTGVKLNGEKTPRYIADPVALTHIAHVLPDIKLIVLLRDPVRRFKSHHRHWNKNLHKGPWVGLPNFLRTRAGKDALWRGCYSTQLRFLFKLFPSEHVRIEFNEAMRVSRSPLNRVQEFLGINRQELGWSPVSDRPVTNPIAGWLKDYYAKHNEELYSLLGRSEVLDWKAHE
jgi:hypothetical protein